MTMLIALSQLQTRLRYDVRAHEGFLGDFLRFSTAFFTGFAGSDLSELEDEASAEFSVST